MLYKIIKKKEANIVFGNDKQSALKKKAKTDLISFLNTVYWNSIFSVMGNITKIKKNFLKTILVCKVQT